MSAQRIEQDSEQANEEIQKHVRTYLKIFGALCVFTVITVAISYLHLEVHEAVGLAMLVAVAKGGLVALFFMHLTHEVPAIYRVLALTVAFFVLVMTIPTTWVNTDMHQSKGIWDQAVPAARQAAAQVHHHGD